MQESLQSGVGRKSATSVGLTTDPFHWLQAGKTVDILRCTAESTDLLQPSALPRPLRSLRDADYRLPPVIVLPLWLFVFGVVAARMLRIDFNQEGGACAVILLLYVLLYYMGRRHNSCSLYMVLALLEIWRILMIPAFGEILRRWNAEVGASPSLSSTHFNCKIKTFRAQLRGVSDINYFLFRLQNIYA